MTNFSLPHDLMRNIWTKLEADVKFKLWLCIQTDNLNTDTKTLQFWQSQGLFKRPHHILDPHYVAGIWVGRDPTLEMYLKAIVSEATMRCAAAIRNYATYLIGTKLNTEDNMLVAHAAFNGHTLLMEHLLSQPIPHSVSDIFHACSYKDQHKAMEIVLRRCHKHPIPHDLMYYFMDRRATKCRSLLMDVLQDIDPELFYDHLHDWLVYSIELCDQEAFHLFLEYEDKYTITARQQMRLITHAVVHSNLPVLHYFLDDAEDTEYAPVYIPMEEKVNHILEESIVQGNLEAFDMIRTYIEEIPITVMTTACASGHPHMVEHLLDIGCPASANAYYWAIFSKHPDVVDVLWNRNVPVVPEGDEYDGISAAIYRKHFHLMEWFHDQGVLYTDDHLVAAMRSKSLPIIEWIACDNDVARDSPLPMLLAIRMDCPKILNIICNNGYLLPPNMPNNTNMIEHCVREAAFNCMKWLIANGYTYDPHHIHFQSCQSTHDVSAIQYFHEIGIPFDTRLCENAILHKRNDVIEYILEHTLPFHESLLDYLLEHGRTWQMDTYLQKTNQVWTRDMFLRATVKQNNSLIEYFPKWIDLDSRFNKFHFEP